MKHYKFKKSRQCSLQENAYVKVWGKLEIITKGKLV